MHQLLRARDNCLNSGNSNLSRKLTATCTFCEPSPQCLLASPCHNTVRVAMIGQHISSWSRSTPSCARPRGLTRALAVKGDPDRVKEARLVTAVKTPYLPSGKIDTDKYDAHIENQIEHGVDGVIVGGTTGEGQLMSWDEHIMLIAHTKSTFGEKVCVIGNTGSNSTREAIHATYQGFVVGMDAALQINPYYGKTSSEGLLEHFRLCLEEGPAMLYNVPGRTGQDIPDDVILALKDHSGFLGMKECTGNPRIASHKQHGIQSWSGNDDEAHDARHFNGGFGVVSVTSNLIPGLYKQMMVERNDALNADLQVCTNSPMFRLLLRLLLRAVRHGGHRAALPP